MTVDQKLTVKLSTTVNNNLYTFEMPMGSQFGAAYDAMHLFLQEITKQANDAVERTKREEITLKTDGDKSSDGKEESS